MGLAPEKASRIYGRDTQTTCPDPWSIQPGVVWGFVNRTKTANDKFYRGLPDGPGIRTSIGRLDFPGYILGRDNNAVMVR